MRHVQNTHDRVTITGHGRAAAVLISADALAALDEKIDILATCGMAEGIAKGLADCASGRQRGITCAIHDHMTSPLCDVRIAARAVGRAAMPIEWE